MEWRCVTGYAIFILACLLSSSECLEQITTISDVDQGGGVHLRRLGKGGHGFGGKKSKHGGGHDYMGGYFGTYPNIPPAPAPIPYPVPVPVPVEAPPPAEDISPSRNVARSPPAAPEYVKREIVVTTDAEIICPEGYSMADDMQCMRLDQQRSKVGCREGWSFQNGTCMGVDAQPANFVCDEGFVMRGEECVLEIFAPKQILCPVGFVLGEDNCVRTVHTEADISCPEEFILIGDECIQNSRTDALLECPPLYTQVGSHCRRDVLSDVTRTCPEMFALFDGICQRVAQAPAVPHCEHPFQLISGACVERFSEPAMMHCNTGILEGDVCVVHFSEASHLECPVGFGLSGPNQCTSESLIPARPECDKHSMFDPKSGLCIGMKKPKHHKKHQSEPSQCEPLWSCPPGYDITPNRECARLETGIAKNVCVLGFAFDPATGMCIKKNVLPVSISCPPMMRQAGTGCVGEKSIPAVLGCPPNMDFNPVEQLCEDVLTCPIQYDCPFGFTMTEQKQCIKTDAVEANPRCPNGFTLEFPVVQSGLRHSPHAGGAQMNPSMPYCVGKSIRPTVAVCPPPYVADSTSDGRVLRCMGEEVAPARIECPEGFLDVDGKCAKSEYGPLRLVCPDGYNSTAGQCVIHLSEKPVIMCPIGYDLFEGDCVKAVYTQARPVCPPTYMYDSLVGVCYKMEIDYDFVSSLPSSLRQPDEEALLSMDETTTTTPPPPIIITQPAPIIQAPPPMPQPTTVQIVQQPIPIPSPVVYLPQQAPPPPPPPPPPMMMPPMPVPVPVPQPIPQPIEIIREVKVPVPVAHHQTVMAVQPQMEQHGKKKKGKKHGGGGGHHNQFY